MAELNGLRVAMVVTDGVEESELIEPKKALEAAGARVDVLAPKAGTIQGFQHHDKSSQIPVDRTIAESNPADYDALMLPGGALNADELRMDPDARSFVMQMESAKKPLAAICHAPWILASLDLLRSRRLTSFPSIQDDLRNAQATWSDEEVVLDANWVTSRKPSDLPAFNKAMITLFAGARQPAATGH